MSGGSLDYFYCRLEEHSGDFGDYELDHLVSDLAKLFKDREWFLSADTGEGAWREARDAFKAKWFGEAARAKRVEEYLENVKDSVMESLGLAVKRCKNCKHWTPREKENDRYGDCDYTKLCLFHRAESCEKFERADGEVD